MRFSLSLLLAALLLAVATPAQATTTDEGLSTGYPSSAITAPGGLWQSKVPAGAQLDPNSATWSQALWHSMGVNDDGTTMPNSSGYRWANGYIVYNIHPAYTPVLTACSRYTASGQGWSWMDSMNAVMATEKVPVPTGALTYDGGSDHSMAIYGSDWYGGRGGYWEFYQGLDDGHGQGTVDADADTFTGAQRFVFNNMPVRLYTYVNGQLQYLYGTDIAPLYTASVTTTGMKFLTSPGGATFDVPESRGSVHVQVYDRQGHVCNRLFSGGGRMANVSTNPGYFLNSGAPVEDNNWGRQATGSMPVIAGLVTPEDRNAMMDGSQQDAGHVLSFVVPSARCGVRFWPAARNDCNGGGRTQSVPEGAWIRFAPDTNCDWLQGQLAVETQVWRQRYLRYAMALCRTFRDYGARVVDQTGVGGAFKYRLPLHIADSWLKDAPDTQNNGYRSQGDYSSMMPWTKLQVLPDGS